MSQTPPRLFNRKYIPSHFLFFIFFMKEVIEISKYFEVEIDGVVYAQIIHTFKEA